MNKEVSDYMLNLENPLIQLFKATASATYYHSENVMLFLEKIGRELKLDIDFLKIIGLYHDIGKMRYPLFYCENQPKGENIHDTLDPLVSTALITSHVSNTISVLTENVPNISMDIIKAISSHHGDQVVQSMYNKITDKTTLDINLFRYPYQKPYDVYSCALMVCDTVEATMKSYNNSGKITSDNLADNITSIIQRLIDEKQLDYLSIGQHRTILSILIEQYSSGDQNRISYEKAE